MNIIPKMARGAGLPFVTYQPVTVNNATLSASNDYSDVASSKGKSSDSDSTKGELTNKDLMTLLKDIDGLPSDMLNLYNELLRFTDFQTLGIPNSTSLSSQYLRAILQIKTAKYNKETFDAAYKELEKNGGLNEVAISATGKLIGMNKDGKIKQLSLEEAQKTEEYQIMTNAELLLYRAEDPRKAGDNDIIKFASNGIGITLVQKLISDIVGKLGSTETSTQGLVGKEGQTLKGLQVLQQAYAREDTQGLGVDGLYKSKVITKTQAEQAEAALNNVMNMLPQNAKTLLMVKGNGAEGAISIVNSIISSGKSETRESSFDLLVDSEGHKLGSDGNKSSKETLKGNVAVQFMNGLGYKENFVINDGTTNGLVLQSNTLSINKKDGTPLGTGSTLQDISQSLYGAMFDMLNATMGGVTLSDAAGMRILTDGLAHGMDLPLDKEAYAKNIIKPDLNAGKKIELAEQYIRENNITDYLEINAVYEKMGVPAKYQADGTLKPGIWARFAAINATALNSAFSSDMTFSSLEEVDDENETQMYLDQLRKTNSWDSDKKFKFDGKSWADRLIGGSYDAFYKGVIYIPIKNNAFNAFAGTGTELKPSEMLDIEAKEQQKERIQGYVNPGSFSN